MKNFFSLCWTLYILVGFVSHVLVPQYTVSQRVQESVTRRTPDIVEFTVDY